MDKLKDKTIIVNGYEIKYSKLYEKWQVKHPNGKILEEFKNKKDAINCAKTIY